MIDSQDDVRSTQEQSLDYQPGAIVFEKFEIIEKLGSGGAGRVYRARQIDLNRLVALKVLSSTIKEARAIVRFQNEARATSMLVHKNIASVMDFGVSKEGEPFMAMELIEGMTLQRLLTLEGQLTISECLTIGFQICDALAHAHQKGIIHRDIKPANIMIVTGPDEEPIVKVLDFGVAKVMKKDEATDGFITDPGAIVGSPPYMSPEQCAGEKVTPQSDLYSTGCVLFQCLSGSPPFVSDNMLELMMMHRQSPIPELEIPDAGPIDHDLMDLVSKLLAKQPSDRPGSATEVCTVLSDLDATLAQSQNEERAKLTSAATAIPADLPPEQSKKVRLFLGTALGAALIVVGCVINYLIAESHREQLPIKDKIERKSYSDYLGLDSPKMAKVFVSGDNDDSDSGIVYMDGPKYTDQDLQRFKNKGRATRVSLTGTRVTDIGIKNLSHLKIHTLDLANSQVRTLDSVGTICSIVELNLTNTPIVDESLRNLQSLTALKSIILDDTKISSRGVLYLASLPNLGNVSIERCPNIKASDIEAIKVEMPYCHFNHSATNYIEELEQKVGQKDFQFFISQTEKCIASVERNFGKDSVKLLRLLGELEMYAREKKNMKLSEQATMRAVQIAKKTGDWNFVIAAQDIQFHHYCGIGEIQNALKTEAKQKALRSSHGIFDQIREAEYLEVIGNTYLNKGKFKEAISMYEQCTKMRRDPVRTSERYDQYFRENYGPNGIQTLTPQIRIGLLDVLLGQKQDAKKRFEALKFFPPLRREHAPFAHIKTAAHQTLSDIYLSEGKLNEAIEENKKAAATCAPYASLVEQQVAVRRQAEILAAEARKKQ